MLIVRSFLRDSNGDFVSIDRVTFPIRDSDYVEGALEFTVNGVEILSLDHWDYVDQLWSYIVNMLEELKGSDSVGTGLPDQPIELKFSKNGAHRVLVQSVCRGSMRSAVVEKAVLLGTLRESGVEFFQRMEELVPESADFYAMERLRLLASC
ncbi:hypothetical protein ACQEVX_13450 [Streptomyces syringium]|uniref:hypothetical protein n=1 Tax=Streptomyces syringium TaxID=76729 RepID=UPI003D910B47